ncbi:MAG TPA: hypothetical protein VF945_13940 [Polyangia bacterium]
MRFLATVAAVAIAGAAGCTAHNPDYTGGVGGDLAGVTLDLAGAVVDLSGPMGACAAGDRKCAGAVASDRCEGGVFVVDRTCPAGSSCANDYCGQPALMLGTQIGARCDLNGGAQQLQCMAKMGLSCQPFVDPATKNLRWFCDSNVGAGTATTHCTTGAQCRSGVCAVKAGICFDACQRDQDCSLAGLTCQSLEITVEGVTVTGKGCA